MINNYARLTGRLEVFKFQETAGGYMLKGRIKIPEECEDRNGVRSVFHTSVNITAWGDRAESMRRLEGEWVSIEGNIETNTYDKNCYSCRSKYTNYYTYVRVSNCVPADKPFGTTEYIYE